MGDFSRVLIKGLFKVSFRIFLRLVLGFSFGDFSRVLVKGLFKVSFRVFLKVFFVFHGSFGNDAYLDMGDSNSSSSNNDKKMFQRMCI